MNDNCLLVGGRGYGGCAILWRSSFSCTVEAVVVVNNRVHIVLINIHGTRLLLYCVYMSCDTRYDSDNIDINNSVFNDIFDSNLFNNVDHILNGGDFNTDLSRAQSAHTVSRNQMCAREFMKYAQNLSRFSTDYTYASKSYFSRSCIDHFVLSEGLCDSVESYSILHDGDNLSDSVTHNTLDVSVIDKLLWDKATTSQLLKYQNNLDQLLCKCDIPDHVLQCDDVFCNVHPHFIQEYHENIVKACLQASSCIPSSKSGVHTKGRPGWTEFVSKNKEKAVFWHKLWKDNGSPH